MSGAACPNRIGWTLVGVNQTPGGDCVCVYENLQGDTRLEECL